MFELLEKGVGASALTRPQNIEYHRVFETAKETGATHFLHGVAVTQHQGRLGVCFAFNDSLENSITEQLLMRWSEDQSRSWSKVEPIAHPRNYANSHSVFLNHGEELWCFGPRFLGLGEGIVTKKGHRSLHFRNLQMEAWRYADGEWRAMGIVAEDFWPLGMPTRMDDGNWIIAGCDHAWLGALAISHGEDFLHWDVVKPDTDGEVLTEAGAWVIGNRVLAVMRNETILTEGRYHAVVALSEDYGRSFGPCKVSNLPMATTKPFCGVLDDGRPYLVFNESVAGAPRDRGRLLLGVGKKGGFSLCKLYIVDEGSLLESQNRRLALSYPYARQIGEKLYLGYSYESQPGNGRNNNDAMLAVVTAREL